MKYDNQNLTRLTLVEKLKNDEKDEATWQDFSSTYRPYIYLLAKNMNLSHQDIEDIIQTVLLRVWKSISKFEHGGKSGQFRRWLTTITRNSVLTFLTKSKKETDKCLKAENEDIKDLVKGIYSPEIDKLIDSEWGTYISNMAWEKIKNDLSKEMQQIFLLTMEGLSRPEISKKLDIPVNTVSVYKRRVLAKMQKEVQWLDRELS